MKTFALQILGLFIVIIVGLMLSTNQGSASFLSFIPGQGPSNSTNQLKITDSTGQTTKAQINIEIAQSTAQKSKGLGDRDSLSTNSGMLFVYEKAEKYRFWMKGMRFPLDFVWINGNKVIDLLPNIPSPGIPTPADSTLPLYTSVTDANKILEVNAGFIAAHNLQVGDIISY